MEESFFQISLERSCFSLGLPAPHSPNSSTCLNPTLPTPHHHAKPLHLVSSCDACLICTQKPPAFLQGAPFLKRRGTKLPSPGQRGHRDPSKPDKAEWLIKTSQCFEYQTLREILYYTGVGGQGGPGGIRLGEKPEYNRKINRQRIFPACRRLRTLPRGQAVSQHLSSRCSVWGNCGQQAQNRSSFINRRDYAGEGSTRKEQGGGRVGGRAAV